MKTAFVGDIVLDKKVEVSKDLKEILSGCDQVVGNFEGVIADKYIQKNKSYGSVICNNSEAFDSLIEQINVTHLSVYNNHMHDYGIEIFNKTLEFIKQRKINILTKKNVMYQTKDQEICLFNSGMVENFALNFNHINYGENIIEMLFEQSFDKYKGNIILSHFGIEKVHGLSDFELKWFEKISSYKPAIIIRHHPHSVQQPFESNGVPCFPSIGDFAFNFNNKKKSNGLIVLYDYASQKISYYIIECSNYQLKLCSDEIIFCNNAPVLLTAKEKKELKARFIKEYRESFKHSFKKTLKYLFQREESEHVLIMNSKHFIQAMIMEEIL